MTEDKSPNLLDYLTAGIIANTFVFLWGFATTFFPVLDYVAFIIYMIGGGLVSYLVCNKTSKDYTIVGVKTSVASWATTMFFFQINVLEMQGLTFALILLVSYSVGGYIGTYLYQKEKLKSSSISKLETSEKNSDESETLTSKEESKAENESPKNDNPEK